MTTIYQYDTNTIIRLDTSVPPEILSTATNIKIMVRKPSDILVEWIANVYQDTSEIEYNTSTNDLDEVGIYILQSYLEFDSLPHRGDSIEMVVSGEFIVSLNIPKIIRLFSTYYRYITVQTLIQYNTVPKEGTDSNILYDSFEIFSELAVNELENILDSRSITLSDVQKYAALCHLIADYFEMGEPDWSYKSQSMSPGVSFSRGEETGPRTALNKLLDQVEKATKMTARSGIRMGESSLNKVKDKTNYPRRYKKTQIPSFDFYDDGFDSEPTNDLGDSINDPLY